MEALEEKIVNQFEEFEKSLNGQTGSVLHKTRKEAIKSFEKLGLPGRKHEEYKYTQLARNLDKHFDLSQLSEPQETEAEALEGIHLFEREANKIVFVNGVAQPQLSNILDDADTLQLLDLSQAFKDHSDVIEQHVGKYIKYDEDAFAAINTAFFQDGAFIRIAKNKTLKYPVILHFITYAEHRSPVYYSRNLILAEENSEANIVETFQSHGGHKAYINHVTEFVVEKSSRVNYFKLQEENDQTYRIDNSQVVQHQQSVFSAYTFTFSGSMIRNNLSVALEDERCEAHMYGLYLTRGQTHVDNHTVVDHKKPNCESNEIYKGILDDQSTGVFNGKIFVREGAQNTNAFQSNKNVVLTEDATVNTKPQLEIWANDVKCSHGCTTGQIDKEQLFYLRSRGFKKDTAIALLLQAFARDVLETIKVPFLKEHLEDIILSRLH